MKHRMATAEDRFSDAYRDMLAELEKGGVGEGAQAVYAGLLEREGEKLVRCIWFDQYLQTDALRTEDGLPVHVVSPGWWNVEPGPDFLNAELKLGDDATVRGDVEIHISSSDWYKHGHHTDPAYRRVKLHVVMENESGDAAVTHTDGRRVPQLVAAKFVDREIADIAQAHLDTRETSPDQPGPCRRWAEAAGEAWVGRFLDAAGDERMIRKAEAFRATLGSRTLDDAAYEGIMDALGYKSNRRPFRRLMRRLPVAELRRFVPHDLDEGARVLLLEAVFFGVAGLMPGEGRDHDGETDQYVARLAATWGRLARELGGRAMRRADWTFGGIRPLNRPERRVAAAAWMFARTPRMTLFGRLLDGMERTRGLASARQRAARAVSVVEDLFGPSGSGYWFTRCTFGGKKLRRPHRLVGRERAAAIAVNVMIPLLLCEARHNADAGLEARTLDIYSALKPLAENHATRYVTGRVFGSREAAKRVVRSSRRQQGLLQLYVDFCNGPQTVCERCLFHRAARAASCPEEV